MKIWKSEYTFNHRWETIAKAAWRKYPNPINPAVVGTDVIERKVINGVLHTHRLVSAKWGLPQWAEALIGSAKICYASELSEVNPDTRQMILKSNNLTFGRYVAIEETVKYSPHPTDEDKTLLTQEAVVTVRGVPLTDYMENLLTNKISLNAGKGRQAMEWVINKLDTEMKDFAISAVHSKYEILNQTKKSLDEISNKAKKSFNDLQHLNASQSMPKI